jgi:hypothetical protein
LKMTVLWVAAPHGLIEVDQRFRGAYCLHHCLDRGGSKQLRSVTQFLQHFMARVSRRLSSSYSLLREPGISLMCCLQGAQQRPAREEAGRKSLPTSCEVSLQVRSSVLEVCFRIIFLQSTL